MKKQDIVRLLDTEREVLREVIKQRKGASQKVRRAQMLLQAEVDGPGWRDDKSAAAFACRVHTVERRRQRLVTDGLEVTLKGRKPDKPPRENTCDGEPEATGLARRLGSPPKGWANWALRLRAERVVELQSVATVGDETSRQTLKKPAGHTVRFSPGSYRPRPMPSAWHLWQTCWTRTLGRLRLWDRSCAWRSSRSRGGRTPASRLGQPPRPRHAWTTQTRGQEQPACAW